MHSFSECHNRLVSKFRDLKSHCWVSSYLMLLSFSFFYSIVFCCVFCMRNVSLLLLRPRERLRSIVMSTYVSPVLKVVWQSWGLPLTSYRLSLIPSLSLPPHVFPRASSWRIGPVHAAAHDRGRRLTANVGQVHCRLQSGGVLPVFWMTIYVGRIAVGISLRTTDFA